MGKVCHGIAKDVVLGVDSIVWPRGDELMSLERELPLNLLATTNLSPPPDATLIWAVLAGKN